MDTYFLEDSYGAFDHKPNIHRKQLLYKLDYFLRKSKVKYKIDKTEREEFTWKVDSATYATFGRRGLKIELDGNYDVPKLCSYLNKELEFYGGYVKKEDDNIIYLYYDKSLREADEMFNNNEDELALPSSLYDDDQINNRKELVEKLEKLLDKNEVEYSIDNDSKKDFIKATPSLVGDRKLCISLLKFDDEARLCSYLNKELLPLGGHVKRDNYNTLFLSYDKSTITEGVISNIRTKVKNRISRLKCSLRPMSKLEASNRYNILPDKDINEIKKDIKKISDEAIKVFSTKDITKYSKVCKSSINSKITEEYLCGVVSKDAYHQIQCIPVVISITDKNISEKEYKELENIIWEDLSNEMDKYVKSLKCKFDIYAGPEIEDYNTPGKQKICLCVTYFQELKPKSAVKESDTLYLPNTMDDLQSLLDNTDPKHIYFTSDWHLLKNRYKSERNYVNCQEIVTWCRQNIKDDDIFMYLGDISYRWIDKKGEEESMKIIASLPGIKVLIAGNHDRMLGDDYLRGCGFKYIFDEYTWKNLIFTHRPINMSLYPEEFWNIHGHIHKWKGYNTTDGKKNINVYPYWFNNKPVTLDYLLKHKEELVKDNYWNVNAMLSETKRSELPDKAFGIPEDRKYPLDTEQHVKSAIKLFGHAEESKKKKLAQNIRSAAKKYDITIPENTQCYRYLNEGSIESIIPEGVNNIIFDMGSVLVNQNTAKAIKEGLFAEEHITHEIEDFLHDKVFSMENKDVDRWYIEDMKNYVKSIAPEFVLKHLDKIFEVIPNGMYIYPYVDELLSILRDKGYSLYYLSNWPRWSYELEKDFFAPLINKFDGGLFSYESKYYMKPDKEFYQTFLSKFKLDPNTCLFFDDKYENISAAESVGIKGCLFNYEETPKQLLGDNLNIPSDANNTILVNMGAKLESVSLDKINWWYLSPNPDNNHPNEELYYKDFNTCVQAITDDQLKDGPIERYVFTCNSDVGDLSCIPIGQILINPDRSSEWLIQYPLEYKDGLYQTVLNEWSMAACNPICGITKPFILKMTNDSGSLINTKQYALSPDLISDKYLVVNENAQLEIVNSNKFKDCFVEIYEFVGNKAYLDKINKAYNEGKIVDNTVFYTMLTGKPMLCEDQIDFDPSFRKIDLAYMKEDTLSKLATMRDNILETKKYNSLWSIAESSNVTINIPFMSKYNKHNDINLKEDFDGYYFYSSMTGKRSSSVKSIDLLTEAMIKTVL